MVSRPIEFEQHGATPRGPVVERTEPHDSLPCACCFLVAAVSFRASIEYANRSARVADQPMALAVTLMSCAVAGPRYSTLNR